MHKDKKKNIIAKTHVYALYDVDKTDYVFK